MLALKAVLLISFLSVWLSQNIDNSIPLFFQLPALASKLFNIVFSETQNNFFLVLKLKSILLLLLCGDVASNPGPTNFEIGNCSMIRNKGPLIFIKYGNLYILALCRGSLSFQFSHSSHYDFIQKLRCTGHGGGVGFLCGKTYSPSITT